MLSGPTERAAERRGRRLASAVAVITLGVAAFHGGIELLELSIPDRPGHRHLTVPFAASALSGAIAARRIKADPRALASLAVALGLVGYPVFDALEPTAYGEVGHWVARVALPGGFAGLFAAIATRYRARSLAVVTVAACAAAIAVWKPLVTLFAGVPVATLVGVAIGSERSIPGEFVTASAAAILAIGFGVRFAYAWPAGEGLCCPPPSWLFLALGAVVFAVAAVPTLSPRRMAAAVAGGTALYAVVVGADVAGSVRHLAVAVPPLVPPAAAGWTVFVVGFRIAQAAVRRDETTVPP